MKTLAFVLFLAGCTDRPIEQPIPCSAARDCDPSDWCVHSWWNGGITLQAGVCAEQCTADEQCSSGLCMKVGDAETVEADPTPTACLP